MFAFYLRTTINKHRQASNGYVQLVTDSNGYNGLSTAMDFTSVKARNLFMRNKTEENQLNFLYEKRKYNRLKRNCKNTYSDMKKTNWHI